MEKYKKPVDFSEEDENWLDDDDVYSNRAQLMEDDEISAAEDGFMEGYEGTDVS